MTSRCAPARSRFSLVVLCPVVVAVAAWMMPAAASELLLPMPPGDTRLRSVAVVDPIPIFVEPGLSPEDTGLRDLRLRALSDALRRQVRTDPRYTLVDRDTARERLAQPMDAAETGLESVAMQSARLGREYFQSFNLRAAIEQLEEAIQLMEQTRLRWSNPDEVAEAWHTLALVWLALAESERRDPDAARRHAVHARRAFREGWRASPARPFDANRYPTTAVEAREEAIMELLAEDAPRLGLTSGQARRLSERLGAELLVEAWGRTDREGTTLHLRVWDAQAERFLPIQRLELMVPTTTTAADALTAALSRTLCCVPTERVPRDPGNAWSPGRPFLAIAPTVGSFIDRPSRRVTLNTGIGIHVMVPVTSEFGLVADSAVEIVQQDRDGDLVRRVDTIRNGVAVRMGTSPGRFRLFADVGVDLLYTGRVRATRNFWCKVSEGEEAEFDPLRFCPPEALVSIAPALSAGPMLALGGALRLDDRFWLTLRARTSAYVVPFASDRALDLPIATELGVGYQF
ncbi:MAG: hypothetical protein EA398_14975 [Deltaproteobacteria bacterium]|nr:MAG: hypothetical protein EA398_14975 [Deltaproteobacteria bacterium]